MSVSGPRVRVEVWDTDPRLPALNAEATVYDESGRGLYLVDALTAGRWGCAPCPAGGKITWAEVSADEQ